MNKNEINKNESIVKRIVFAAMISLFVLMLVPLGSAADLGFDDFLPDDPLALLTSVGILDIILLCLGLLFAVAAIIAVAALLMGIIKIALGVLRQDSVAIKNGTGAMLSVVMGVVLFFILGTFLFFVFAML